MKVLVKNVEEMSGPELVAAYNDLTGEEVKRFSNRETGIRRVRQALDREAGAAPLEKVEQVPGKFHLPAREGTLTQHRPSTDRGKVISLMSRPQGATMEELTEEVQKDSGWVKRALHAINRSHGCEIVQLPEGGYHLPCPPDDSKRLNLEPGDVRKPPRAGSKRAKILELLREPRTLHEVGGTLGMSEVRVREAICILNRHHGYGFRQVDDGKVEVVP